MSQLLVAIEPIICYVRTNTEIIFTSFYILFYYQYNFNLHFNVPIIMIIIIIMIQGIRLANNLNDVLLFADSGEILEQQKQYSEAAAMYIKGEQYERAADMYIRHLIKGDKNKITEAAAIMEKVQNDQLNSSFAKACMSCGRYQEAGENRAVVRIDLVHLVRRLAHALVARGKDVAGGRIVDPGGELKITGKSNRRY